MTPIGNSLEVTANPTRSNERGDGGHESGDDGKGKFKTSGRKEKSESDEIDSATPDLLTDEGGNSQKKALFSPFYPHFHHVLDLWLSDRKVKGDEEEVDGNKPMKRRVKGVLKLSRIGETDELSSLNESTSSNMTGDGSYNDSTNGNTVEGEAEASKVVDNADGNDDQGGNEEDPPTCCQSIKLPARRVRNDVRHRYLTNLGIVPNQGGPPAIVRRPSFDSTRDPIVEEKLKDQKDSDMTLDDLVRVIKSLVGPGSRDEDDSQARPDLCDVCRDELRGLRDSVENTQHREASPGYEYTCPHKRVKFSNTVAAVYVPTHQEYSNRVRQSYWAGVGEIREMVYRNMIEFDAEGYRWENVAEEEDMYYCDSRGEYIHPVFCDADNTATEVVDDGVGSAVFLNEGKNLPTLNQNEGIWA